MRLGLFVRRRIVFDEVVAFMITGRQEVLIIYGMFPSGRPVGALLVKPTVAVVTGETPQLAGL